MSQSTFGIVFPKFGVLYNRFVELRRREVGYSPLALFIKKVLLGKCTGISLLTALRSGYVEISVSIFKGPSRVRPKRQVLHGVVLWL
jgi:hypothetical protein